MWRDAPGTGPYLIFRRVAVRTMGYIPRLPGEEEEAAPQGSRLQGRIQKGAHVSSTAYGSRFRFGFERELV